MTDGFENKMVGREPWGWSRRLGFRFVLIAVLLLALPFPFGLFGISSPINGWWDNLWAPVVPWVAKHVLHADTDFPRWGGSETTWYYVQVGTAVTVAFAAAVIWSVVDRRRTDLRRMDYWFRVYLRLFLAAVLFVYGWGKVVPNQFEALGPDRLSEMFGEASPSGFGWAFMGYSTGYMIFAGTGELAAGLLLCFRRTTTLGAMVGIAVMSNVVAFNFAFDIGVKLDAMFYLLGLIYLVAPDLSRLLDVLVFNRVTHPRVLSPPAVGPGIRLVAVGVPAVLAAFFFARAGMNSWVAAHERGRLAPHPPLYGLYDVESVKRDGVSQSLVSADTALWSRVAIGQLRSTIRRASGTLGFYVANVDTTVRSVRFTSRDDATEVFSLVYETPDAGHLILRGQWGSDSVQLLLRRRDETQYHLVSHPFHWIHNTNENR